MARHELQGRDNWQTESGPGGKAGKAEQDLYEVFRGAFKETDYIISDHPSKTKKPYQNFSGKAFHVTGVTDLSPTRHSYSHKGLGHFL